MADASLDIEWIVREVTRRLAEYPGQSGDGANTARNGASCGGKTLTVAARVVCLAEVTGRLEGVRKIIVRPDAVLTPAVRDLLKEKHIALEVAAPATTVPGVGPRVCVGVAGTTFDPAALLRSVAARGVQVESLARTGLVTVVEELADHVGRGGSLGVLVTGEQVAAVCLANRHWGVRAVRGESAAAVEEGIRAVGANLLVVGPSKSNVELERIVGVFCAADGRSCPEHLRRQLG